MITSSDQKARLFVMRQGISFQRAPQHRIMFCLKYTWEYAAVSAKPPETIVQSGEGNSQQWLLRNGTKEAKFLSGRFDPGF
jgi:hypothetical protein